MKRYSGLLVAGLLATSLPVNAAFQSVQTDVKTAGVTLTGGSVSFTATVKNKSNNQTATSITWTGVTPGSTAWAEADQYIEMASVVSLSNGFIRTYTDNTATTASPRYTGPNNSSATPAGLVNGTNTTSVQPLAWSIQDALTGGRPNGVGDPNNSTQYYYWFYYTDIAQVTFNNPTVQTYNTVVGPGNAIHFAQGGGSFPDPAQFGAAASPNYMFFEANFTGALGGTQYQTNKLTLEAYTI